MGEAVETTAAYAKYLSITGHPESDEYVAASLSYNAKKCFIANLQIDAVYADDLIIKYAPWSFGASLWICKVLPGDDGHTLLVKHTACLSGPGPERRIYLILENVHYECLQRRSEDWLEKHLLQKHLLANEKASKKINSPKKIKSPKKKNKQNKGKPSNCVTSTR